jgi:hypothetical protein
VPSIIAPGAPTNVKGLYLGCKPFSFSPDTIKPGTRANFSNVPQAEVRDRFEYAQITVINATSSFEVVDAAEKVDGRSG